MEFMYEGTMLRLVTARYEVNDNLAVRIVDAATGEPWATLSVNVIENGHLPDGVFYVKDWSENADIAQTVIDAGLIVPACGIGVPIAICGYEWAEPYKFAS